MARPEQSKNGSANGKPAHRATRTQCADRFGVKDLT